MNISMGKKSVGRALGSLALAVLLVSSVLLAGAAPALAAGEGMPPQPEETGQRGTVRLEFAYLRLQHVAQDQAMHLSHAGEVADFIQGWIDELAANGQDVTALQSALDDFEAALAEAQGHYDQAKAILDQHAGFDDAGKVTDRQQAAETLRQAGRSLRDSRRTLQDGVIALRRAIGDWRRAHRPGQIDS
ncbi:MAG: hypothetical protein Kow0063_31180 [Anaerolineae bacterium]